MNFKDRITKIKKIHSIISSTIFFVVLLFCISNNNELNLSDHSLSHFGVAYKTSQLWNWSLFGLGVFLYLHALRSIFKYYTDGKISSNLIILFSFSSLSLLLTALIDMRFKIHNFFAISYFIGYIISIFLFGYKLLAADFRIGMTSIIISISCLIIPITTTYIFKGWAIPELIHTLFILCWVLVLSFDKEWKQLLKKIGF